MVERAQRLAFEVLENSTRTNGALIGFVPFASDTWDYSQVGAGVMRVDAYGLSVQDRRARKHLDNPPALYDRLHIKLIEGAKLPDFSLRQRREILKLYKEHC